MKTDASHFKIELISRTLVYVRACVNVSACVINTN